MVSKNDNSIVVKSQIVMLKQLIVWLCCVRQWETWTFDHLSQQCWPFCWVPEDRTLYSMTFQLPYSLVVTSCSRSVPFKCSLPLCHSSVGPDHIIKQQLPHWLVGWICDCRSDPGPSSTWRLNSRLWIEEQRTRRHLLTLLISNQLTLC